MVPSSRFPGGEKPLRLNDPEALPALETRTRALLAADTLTEPTRRALTDRLDWTPGPLRVLSPDQMRALEAVCLRLIPDPALVERIALAARLEARLADGVPRGWRYAQTPDDLTLYCAGLDALDAAAKDRHGHAFAELAPDAQDALLKAACSGDLKASVLLDRWFEETLSALVEHYYAHPLIQVSIGYDGMADAHGVSAVSPAAIAEEARARGR